MEKHRIVVVGGGFAGVWAALGAASLLQARGAQDTVAITVISPDEALVVRPRLYESDLSGTRVPLGAVLGPLDIAHVRGRVESIDPDRRELTLSRGGGDGIRYDQLVLCTGSQLRLPERSGGVHCVDSYRQAVELHQAVAALCDRPAAPFTATVVGAGYTGIEVATELADMLRAAARAAGASEPDVPVQLVERTESVAPEFGPAARAVIEAALDSLGVQVRTGVVVSNVDRAGATLDGGERLEADLTVWTGGPRASAVNLQLGVPLDPLGRLKVGPHMETGIDGVWAAGDSACASADGEHLAVMSCQHAMPQGRQAGENAAAALLGLPLGDYRQPLYLTCLDLGSAGALLTSGFERDDILATGNEAKRFKRFINRSLIYPPCSQDARELLKTGRSKPPTQLAAATQRLALRSTRLRDTVIGRAEDRADQWAAASA